MGTKVYQTWIISILISIFIVFALIASVTIYIDPCFHYHAPLEKYEYPINSERYQNDGIVRNFEYDGIITGNSMTQNFMVSEADKIFHADFVKVPFSGGYYKEINDNLKRAYESKNNIKYVIRCLDYNRLAVEEDTERTDEEYPNYLYNDNLFDDLNYVLNKSILFARTLEVIKYTSDGNKTTSFDVYSNWSQKYTFGAETVLSTYTLGEKSGKLRQLTEEECNVILGNISKNVTELADEHKETTFFLFFPPYSICYWDTLNNNGEINWHIDAEEIAIKELLKHSNIKLYSFCNNFDLVCNLDNYKDRGHYGEWVNSWMLEWMWNGDYQLTEDNYQEYLESIRNFYNSYDYSSLRE